MKNLKDKKILLVICGGIAAYKGLETIRIFKKKWLCYKNNFNKKC